jgi:ribonuclease HII
MTSEPKAHSSDTCGIDEVGRGPLAGPVVAAAIILSEGTDTSLLNDSKKLSATKRRAAVAHLLEQQCAIGIGWVHAAEIDTLNIHRASLYAMELAYRELTLWHPHRTVDRVLVDGRFCPTLPVPCTAITKGDATEAPIMAASIIAKEVRDAWMQRYARIDPRYGFEQHKGYPTALHAARLAVHGPAPIHRRSFRGVSELRSANGHS